MYREGSNERGFTLMEVTVALVASGILLVGLARFFKDFNRSYNNQEQVSDRDLNAHYAVKRLSEAVMSAGSGLPSTGWDIISLPDGNPGARLRLSVNPRGGVQYLTVDLVGKNEVAVEDAKGFAKATAILTDPQNPLLPTLRVPIDVTYNSNGFVKGVRTTGESAVLRLTGAVNLKVGDAIYAYDEEVYRLQSGSLTLNGMILAENIQSLAFTAYASNQTRTPLWSSMRSIRIQVTARTRNRDPNFSANGGYRAIDLSMDVLLRNRL